MKSMKSIPNGIFKIDYSKILTSILEYFAANQVVSQIRDFNVLFIRNIRNITVIVSKYHLPIATSDAL